MAAMAIAGTALAGSALCAQVPPELHLFVDRSEIQSMRDCHLKLHSPVRREAVFTYDAPWEGAMSGYITVLKAPEGFRMYYRAQTDENSREYTCMAESKDGIHWKRPSPGLIEYNGSKDNNIIYTGSAKGYRESHNFTPFVDLNPAAPADERWKALGLGRYVLPSGEDIRALTALVSEDGIHWRKLQETPVMHEGSFDSQNVAFWDTVRNQYVCYLRAGRNGKRAVQRATSPDFREWSSPEWLEYEGAPLEQFYTNAIAPYLRDPRWYFGFPMRFVPERKTIGNPPREVDGLSDGVFISSRDGLNFARTFMEAFIRPGLSEQNWGNAHGNNTPAWGLLQTGPAEISIYWTENYGKIPQLRRGTLRLDGFASVNAPYSGGEIITRPVRVSGSRLALNFSTSAVGEIRVEAQDSSGASIPGFSLAECEPIYGDEIARSVHWKNRAGLTSLQGRDVRLRFRMKDADLYSFRFER